MAEIASEGDCDADDRIRVFPKDFHTLDVTSGLRSVEHQKKKLVVEIRASVGININYFIFRQ